MLFYICIGIFIFRSTFYENMSAVYYKEEFLISPI